MSYRQPWRRRSPWPARSLRRSLIDAGIFIAAALLVLLAVRIFNQVTIVPGAAYIIDGDSFRLGKDEIRLTGIDAPEYRQTCRTEKGSEWNCGRAAADALRRLVSGREVDCKGVDADRYGRLVARCTAGGIDLNTEMVRLGWAIAYSRHDMSYVDEELEARRQRRGIWRGTFDLPEDWREIHRPNHDRSPHD